jgi:integrase
MPGSIQRRGSSAWIVVVDHGRDPATGKRRQVRRSLKGTKRDAEQLLVRLLHDRDHGITQPVEHLTVRDYLVDRYLPHVQAHREARTYLTARDICVKHLIPALGNLRLAKLRAADIQAYYDRKLTSGRLDGRGGLSAASVQRHHQVLHAALRHAADLDLIPRNPADRAKAPVKDRKEFRALTPTEAEALLRAADAAGFGAIIRVALWTGLRLGELLGLRWSDIDLGARVLSVQQTVQEIAGQGLVLKAPKTHRSRRAVDLSPLTIAVLTEHRQRQMEARLKAGPAYQDYNLVFANSLGMPTGPSNLKRAFRGIVRRAGIGHVRLHDLRHTHASLMLASGEHLKVVSDRLGHASVAITGDLYSHVAPGLGRAAADRLDRLFEPGAAAR